MGRVGAARRYRRAVLWRPTCFNTSALAPARLNPRSTALPLWSGSKGISRITRPIRSGAWARIPSSRNGSSIRNSRGRPALGLRSVSRFFSRGEAPDRARPAPQAGAIAPPSGSRAILSVIPNGTNQWAHAVPSITTGGATEDMDTPSTLRRSSSSTRRVRRDLNSGEDCFLYHRRAPKRPAQTAGCAPLGAGRHGQNRDDR